jgi:hypothetical protein
MPNASDFSRRVDISGQKSETHLVFRGTSSTPTQESSSSNVLAGPIPPPSIQIDPSARENIPGIYGRHGYHGYYAGPTSAASQLLTVGRSLSFYTGRESQSYATGGSEVSNSVQRST